MKFRFWNSGAQRVPVALALQGGGAHGAYTWGVLDALLEQDFLSIDAISGTSAGAVNAVVLAHGLAHGLDAGGRANGRDAAREALAKFWTTLGEQVPFDLITRGEGTERGFTPLARMFMQWTQLLSPYEVNPMRVNPLGDLLSAHVDFERLRRQSAVQLHVAATHANTGRLRLFATHEITVETVLASACLPSLHHAVEIDGQPYWDGGYSANPAVFPLLDAARARDLILVLLSPSSLGDTPRTADEIRQRTLDIAFNSNFLREMRTISQAVAWARRGGWMQGPLERRLRGTRFHLVEDGELLGSLRGETRLIAHRPFLEELRDAGRERALAWLQAHRGDLGVRSSVDLAAVFG